jgi:4-hydroxy-3-polyprenylbenzoate decarboxylase
MTDGEKKFPKRLIVGISGASGIAFGWRIVELLTSTNIETHLIISKAAELTLSLEMDKKASELKEMADVVHSPKDIGASIASGTFRTMGMVIAPCSIKTMSEISTGITSSLMSRAADVVLKERRKLVLMVRESPLHLGHLRTMQNLTEIGAIIAPPVPALYTKPETLDELITQTAARTLDLFEIDLPDLKRWKED